MALDLVDKRDPSRAEILSEEEERAIRAVAEGAANAVCAAADLSVIRRAREEGLWLRCACRSEDGRHPRVVPCRNSRGPHYWSARTGRHPRHDEGCVFNRMRLRSRRRPKWNRARKAPDGYFAVLRDQPEDRRVSLPSRRAARRCLSIF